METGKPHAAVARIDRCLADRPECALLSSGPMTDHCQPVLARLDAGAAQALLDHARVIVYRPLESMETVQEP
jgi:hypothetical protein